MAQQLTSDQVTKIATDAATQVYNKLGSQWSPNKTPVHVHNGHDTLKISYNDLTNQPTNFVTSVTGTAPLSATAGTTPVISIDTTLLVPTGTILMFGGAYNAIPTGYLLCDGNSYSKTTYAALYAVIGYTYGNPGGSNFNVPYFSGRVPIGDGGIAGSGGGTSGTAGTRPSGGSALTTAAAGSWKGEETHTLTIAELATHTHDIPTGVSPGGGAVNGTPGNYASNLDAGFLTVQTGSSTPHNTIQPVLSVNFIIKT